MVVVVEVWVVDVVGRLSNGKTFFHNGSEQGSKISRWVSETFVRGRKLQVRALLLPGVHAKKKRQPALSTPQPHQPIHHPLHTLTMVRPRSPSPPAPSPPSSFPSPLPPHPSKPPPILLTPSPTGRQTPHATTARSAAVPLRRHRPRRHDQIRMDLQHPPRLLRLLHRPPAFAQLHESGHGRVQGEGSGDDD